MIQTRQQTYRAQRLGIAGALLGDPGVVLFDDPVNGLDPELTNASVECRVQSAGHLDRRPAS